MICRYINSLAAGLLLGSVCFVGGCGTQATPQPNSSTKSPPSNVQTPQEITRSEGVQANGDSPPETSQPQTAEVTRPEQSQEAAAPAKRPDIYNASADSRADIAAAIGRAKRDNKRVLVMYGGNWCGWCYKLHDVFDKNREIAGSLRNDFERVMVDIGRFDKNMDIAASYGADLKAHGVPYLTVLDADGNVLTNKDTGELEDGPLHDVAKVREFLASWSPEQIDAVQVLASAKSQAKDEGKLLFVHLGAPWCGWCHRLDEFLEQYGAMFEKDYLFAKIDIDRMAHGKSVAEELRGGLEGGIPWFAILDSSGTKLSTSDGPGGNIGYPAEPKEIEHFISMLQATAKTMTPEQINEVQSILTEAAKKFVSH